MKRFASLLLALAMAFAMSTTAFAANGTNSSDGKITIDNAVVGQTYTIYQILKLESYDTEKGTYAYKATEAWKSFVEGTGIKDVYLATDESGYVTWIDKNLTCKSTEEGHAHGDACYTKTDVAAFAKLAKDFAAKLSANQGSTTAAAATVEFTGLNLGYYLVNSTLGTLCSLDTTSKEVTIQEKNSKPTLDKQVKEDSKPEASAWGDENDADISQTVEFKATITVQGAAKGYVMHDTMSAGLTFQQVSKVTLNGKDVAAGSYSVKKAADENNKPADGCTFEVVFTEAFCSSLKTGDVIVVYYEAELNSGAVVGLNGNTNKAHLSYKDESGTDFTTTEDTTTTYTWDMEVLKYANGNKDTKLAGVKFVLLNSDRTKVATVAGGKLTGWEAVPAEENGKINWPAASVLTTGEGGKIHIDGLDADTYYLREIEALPGFNVLNEDQQFAITGATKAENSDDLTYTTYVAEINNQSGAELPSTGGMGTTLFYVLGGALVIGAAVLLVVKRRMNGAER